MNWEAIGAIGEIISAIAVIGTLAYLARQISQGVNVARAAQNRAVMDSYERLNELILANPTISELLATLQDNAAEVSGVENIRVRHLAYRMMNLQATAQLAFTTGHLGQDEFALYKMDVENWVKMYPGLLPHFKANLEMYSVMKDYEIFEFLK